MQTLTAEIRRQEDRQPVLLMAPKILVLDARTRRAAEAGKASISLRRHSACSRSAVCASKFLGQIASCRIAAGNMGRQIKRNGGLRPDGEQFVEVFSAEHRLVAIGKRPFPTPGPSFPTNPRRRTDRSS